LDYGPAKSTPGSRGCNGRSFLFVSGQYVTNLQNEPGAAAFFRGQGRTDSLPGYFPGKGPSKVKDLAALRKRAAEKTGWGDLSPGGYLPLIRRAKAEDLNGEGLRRSPLYQTDVTSGLLDPAVYGSARLVARTPGKVCGLPLAREVLRHYDERLSLQDPVEDGSSVEAGSVLATLEGPAASLLSAERVLLNFLQKLSGIATQTGRYVAALGDSCTRILDTRKTTPGYRVLEKYAVACGGGWNHRIGLYDRVMLKDNHLAATGATGGDRLAAAVEQAREACPDLLIEVEVDHLEQIDPALEAGADIFLLDNFTPADLRKAVALLQDRALTEASGGIELDRLPELASLGLDFISTGALTHQATWTDIGLDWK